MTQNSWLRRCTGRGTTGLSRTWSERWACPRRTPHDTAQVLGQADIALGARGHARKAIGITQSIGTSTADDAVRLHINARFAEVVSLNTLGLWGEARMAIASTTDRALRLITDDVIL
jgi:hypothetical protein